MASPREQPPEATFLQVNNANAGFRQLSNSATQCRRIQSQSGPITHGQPSTLRSSPAASCVAALPTQGTSLRSLVSGSIKARPPKVSGAERQATVARQPEAQPRRGLTRRSTGRITAGQLGPVGGTRYIFANRAKLPCRAAPVNSNVGPQKRHLCPATTGAR